MSFLVAIASSLVFAAILSTLGINTGLRNLLEGARDTMRVMNDDGKSDLEKERAARKASMVIAGGAVGIILKTCVAVILPAAIVLVALQTGLSDARSLSASFLSWQAFAAAGCIMLCDAIMRR